MAARLGQSVTGTAQTKFTRLTVGITKWLLLANEIMLKLLKREPLRENINIQETNLKMHLGHNGKYLSPIFLNEHQAILLIQQKGEDLLYLGTIHKLLHTKFIIFLPLPRLCHRWSHFWDPPSSMKSHVLKFYTYKLLN